MKTPTLTHYLETIANPGGRFRTLIGAEFPRDASGAITYSVHSKTLDILLHHRGKTWMLCCPLRNYAAYDLLDYVQERYLQASYKREKAKILLNELLVFDDRDQSQWYDVILVEVFSGQLRKPGDPAIVREPIATYEITGAFLEGLAPACENGLYGYLDRDQQVVIPFAYEWADTFEEGLAVVESNGWFGVIDKSGKTVLEPVFEDIRWRAENGVILAAGENGQWRLFSRSGESVTPETFDFIYDFSCGLASVRRGDKYGFIDRTGSVVIPFLYEEAYSYTEEGLATVIKNGRVFTLDTEGMVFD